MDKNTFDLKNHKFGCRCFYCVNYKHLFKKFNNTDFVDEDDKHEFVNFVTNKRNLNHKPNCPCYYCIKSKTFLVNSNKEPIEHNETRTNHKSDCYCIYCLDYITRYQKVNNTDLINQTDKYKYIDYITGKKNLNHNVNCGCFYCMELNSLLIDEFLPIVYQYQKQNKLD